MSEQSVASRILERLREGWRPAARDLAGAPIVSEWRILSVGPGPYLLQGTVEGRPILNVVIALDASARWARTPDRWLILGGRSPELQRVVSESEIMSRAADWMKRYPDAGR